MSTHWTEDVQPLCDVCHEPGRRVRPGIYDHALPLGGDGVGPSAHGFKAPVTFTEPDPRRAAIRVVGLCDECGCEIPMGHECG